MKQERVRAPGLVPASSLPRFMPGSAQAIDPSFLGPSFRFLSPTFIRHCLGDAFLCPGQGTGWRVIAFARNLHIF